MYLFLYYKGTAQTSFSKEPGIFILGSVGLHLLPWQSNYNEKSFFFCQQKDRVNFIEST